MFSAQRQNAPTSPVRFMVATPERDEPRSPIFHVEREPELVVEKQPTVVVINKGCDGYNFISNANFWAYIGIVIIFALIAWTFIEPNLAWYDGLTKPVWVLNRNILTIVVLVALFFQVYAAYFSNISNGSGISRNITNFIFVVQLALVLLWAYAFFVLRNLNLTIFVGLAVVLLSLWWFFMTWGTNRGLAWVILILGIFWAYLTLINFQIAQVNGAPIIPPAV